jgi:hypothetical protein
MAVTREYADGHERIFGSKEAHFAGVTLGALAPTKTMPVTANTPTAMNASSARAQPGRWVQDGADSQRATGPVTEEARNAPVMVDRFYENTSVPVYENGQVKQVDIGSRKRHREYMRQRGLTTADDFDKPGGEWERAAKEREQRAKGIFPDARERRQELGRIAYEWRRRRARRR